MTGDSGRNDGAARSAPTDGGLTDLERTRFARHLSLAEVGEQGQRLLRGARVAIVGVGGLGCPAALYLAAAGVGHLTLIDDDRVELSNLQRQVLFTTEDVGRAKVDAAAERLRALDPSIGLTCHRERLVPGNAEALLRGHDVIVEGSDNFPTKYAASDGAIRVGVPLVAASVERFHAQVALFGVSEGPCYRCLFPEPPAPGSAPDCSQAGVLGVLPGVAGAFQAAEALKLLLGIGPDRTGRLLTLDLVTHRVRDFAITREPACPACGPDRSTEPLPVPDPACASMPEVAGAPPFSISVDELAARLGNGDRLAILDVRMPAEWLGGHLDGSRLIPLSELGARLAEIETGRETIVVCAVGQRSAYATRLLRSAGLAEARNLEGGLRAWALGGHPLVTGP